MIIVIQGGSGSGKSAYAEEKAVALSKESIARHGPALYYLATMRPFDTEAQKKVERHQQMRLGKGFMTIEQPVCIEAAAGQMKAQATVLLECMSNLVANEMFADSVPSGRGEVAARIINGLSAVAKIVEHVIIVTNNIFEDGIIYDEITKQYMDALALVNREICKMADEVTEVVVGIPLSIRQKEGKQ